MRTLAIDHGLARCGCAISDPSGTVVRPLEPIEPTDVEALARLVEAEGAEAVVVGMPVTLEGEEGEQARIVREFRDELQRLVEVPIDVWDERLTTAMAGASRRGGATAAADSLAAAHLLESYLASLQSRPGEATEEP